MVAAFCEKMLIVLRSPSSFSGHFLKPINDLVKFVLETIILAKSLVSPFKPEVRIKPKLLLRLAKVKAKTWAFVFDHKKVVKMVFDDLTRRVKIKNNCIMILLGPALNSGKPLCSSASRNCSTPVASKVKASVLRTINQTPVRNFRRINRDHTNDVAVVFPQPDLSAGFSARSPGIAIWIILVKFRRPREHPIKSVGVGKAKARKKNENKIFREFHVGTSFGSATLYSKKVFCQQKTPDPCHWDPACYKAAFWQTALTCLSRETRYRLQVLTTRPVTRTVFRPNLLSELYKI